MQALHTAATGMAAQELNVQVISNNIANLNTTARLKEIKHPVLAITGEQDAAAPGTRYIGENVPGARLVVIPQAAHIANIEQAGAFNRALAEFLSSPASARA